MKTAIPVVSALLALVVFVSSAHAGTITMAIPDPGATVFPPVNILQNNDDNPNVDNLLFITKVFQNTGAIDIVFTVINSGVVAPGVSEYLVRETVDNDTGTDWAAYEASLGFGTGAQFVLSSPGDGLDFDTPNLDASAEPLPNVFATVQKISEDQILWSNGTQSSAAVNYAFRIDVPDGIDVFTLRQMPTPVPEPTSLMLLGIGLAAMAVWTRRRRTA